jgi:hypothetical protein
MVARREVHGHVEKLAQCTAEGGNKFHALVGSDMEWNTVFGKNVDEEESGELDRGYMSVAGEKNNLLECMVNNDANAIKLVGNGRNSMKAMDIECQGWRMTSNGRRRLYGLCRGALLHLQ